MPRLGMGMPVTASGERAAALAVDDNFWLNDVNNHITPDFTGTRKNLLLQSQTFKTTWTLNNVTIPNDLYEAPDNSLTAQNIAATSAGASNVFVQQVFAVTLGETYTFSIHLKKGAQTFGRLRVVIGGVVFSMICNLTTGAITNTGNVPVVNRHFDKMDDDWIRFGLTFQATATSSGATIRVYTLGSTASSTATSAAFQAGTELMYLWGAQLEEDSRTSEYLVTTNTAVTKTVPLVDFHDSWDHDVDGDGVKTNDITIEADPDGEGVWDVDANGDLIPLDV